MSADSYSINTHAPFEVCLSSNLSDADRHATQSLLALLPPDCISDIVNDNQVSDIQTNNDSETAPSHVSIKRMVDGRGMACPMPLLKTKVALRDVATHESLYVVATDPNSRADITAFCRQTQQAAHGDTLLLMVNQMTGEQTANSLPKQPPDTIFHFIITKTDSN